MDFESRLQRAIQRGQKTKATAAEERLQAEMTDEECKSLHSRCRVDLSEHIERCLKQVADHFPAFDYEWAAGAGGADRTDGGTRVPR